MKIKTLKKHLSLLLTVLMIVGIFPNGFTVYALGEENHSHSEACSLRRAVLAEKETVAACDSLGRVLASPTVSCPPAVPVVVSGEVIDEAAIALFKLHGIERVEVVKQPLFPGNVF